MLTAESLSDINTESIFIDHGLQGIDPKLFTDQQRKSSRMFRPHFAYHATIDLVEHPDTELLLARKRFGLGERKIPYSVALELANDYRIHQNRLTEVGVRTALSYALSVEEVGNFGIITAYQLFFPENTLSDWMTNPNIPTVNVSRAVEATLEDTLIPILDHSQKGLAPDQSWVFSDGAPKNVAPISIDGNTRTFYVDLFVPRVRNHDGTVKEYPNYNPHIRTEKEMRRRFFTKPGVLHNFVSKARIDLKGDDLGWSLFAEVAQNRLHPYLNQYFSGQSLDEIANIRYGKIDDQEGEK